MENYQNMSFVQMLQNLTNYAQLVDQQTKIGQKIKKTNLKILITHMRTIKHILDFYITYQGITQKFENLNELLEKLKADWKNAEYSQIKQLSNEDELQKNLLYLTYHLQNPQVPLELAYSIFSNKNYEFLQISINNKYDKLSLYKKAQKINQKHLKKLINDAIQGLFNINKSLHYIFVSKDDLKIKLGVSIYNLTENQEVIYWIVLDIYYQDQQIENDIQIINTLNSVILHILQNSSTKEQQKIRTHFYSFVYYILKQIYLQNLVQKIYKISENKDSLVYIQEHSANHTKTHKCYKLMLTKNIKNKYYYCLFDVLNFSQKETLDYIDWTNFDFQTQSRIPFQQIIFKTGIPIYEMSNDILSKMANQKFEFQTINTLINKKKAIQITLDNYNEHELIREVYMYFYPTFMYKLYKKFLELNMNCKLYLHNKLDNDQSQNTFYKNFYIELEQNSSTYKIENLDYKKIPQKSINFNITLLNTESKNIQKNLKEDIKEVVKNNF